MKERGVSAPESGWHSSALLIDDDQVKLLNSDEGNQILNSMSIQNQYMQ